MWQVNVAIWPEKRKKNRFKSIQGLYCFAYSLSSNFFSTIKQFKMDVSAYQQLVTGYYLFESMPDNVIDNWYRYICTDGENCKEVEADYLPIDNEMVFFCSITGGRTKVELFKNGGEIKKQV